MVNQMINYDDLLMFIISQITSEYEDYEDDPLRFIFSSIQEFTDYDDDIKILELYDSIKPELTYTIAEYESKWR